MKLNPKVELQIQYVIQNLGEANINEIKEQYKKEYGIELTEKEILRQVRRLKAKKVVVTNVVGGEAVHKIADIPWQPMDNMAGVSTKTTMNPEEIKGIQQVELDKASKKRSDVNANKYRNFRKFEMTFELIDDVLGDRIDGDETGKFPTDAQGNIFIPPSWWKGFFRSNLYALNIPEAVAKFRLGYSSIGIYNGKEKVELVSRNCIGDKV